VRSFLNNSEIKKIIDLIAKTNQDNSIINKEEIEAFISSKLNDFLTVVPSMVDIVKNTKSQIEDKIWVGDKPPKTPKLNQLWIDTSN
jgi:hypothetical protein